MSISINRYVDITSGVGGGAAVAQRQLVGRIVTKSTHLASDEIFEATSASAVLAKFGNDVSSKEYRRAAAYFSFVSKTIKSPKMLSFVRWDTVTFRPPVFKGNTEPKTPSMLTDLKAMGADAGFEIGYGTGAMINVTFDATAAGDFIELAPIIEAALHTAAAATPVLATATVQFNAASNRFIITGSLNGTSAGEIKVAAASTHDAAQILGLISGDTDSTAGRVGDNAVQTMDRHAKASDNFGSFLFVDALDNWQSTTVGSRPQDVAEWNATFNNKYIFCHYVTPMQATAAWFAKFRGYAGLAMTLCQDNGAQPSIDDEVFQAQSPMEILAATDYESVNGTQNFMFYQFDSRSFAADARGNLAPRPGTVGDDAVADAMDAYRINYQGITMQAGQQIAFYQRGLLMGGPTAATDINVYANEMWLKDAFLTVIMSLFLSLPKVSANEIGRGQLLLQMVGVADRALNNGTFSVGKPLDSTQKAYITQITGDDKAWHQVQGAGYWLDATLVKEVNHQTGLNEWQFKYTLVYSKDDVIRKVIGSDILI